MRRVDGTVVDFILIMVLVSWVGYYLIYFESDYYKYCLTSKSYTISTGIIDHIDEYEIIFKGRSGIIIRRAVVSYEVNGREYRAFDISMSYKEDVGSVIQIAINKNDPTKILRNEFLPLELGAKSIIVFDILYLLYLFGFINMPMSGWIKKKKQKRISKQLREFELKKQQDMELQIREKQAKVLHIMKSKNIKNGTECEKIKAGMLEHEIQWNSDWLWCVNNLYPEELFFLEKEDREYKFIALTLNLREHGLPLEYYVIGQDRDCFYCCSSDSMRVFVFSNALGITNTPYADIYDYLIEQTKS